MRGLFLFAFLAFFQTAFAQISLKPDFYRTCTIIFNEGYCEALKDRSKELYGQAKEGGLIMLDTFHHDIRPPIMKAYKSYLNGPGAKVSEYALRSHDYLKPRAVEIYNRTVEYWYDQNPQLFDEIRYLPKPLKTATEELLFYIWDQNKDKIESGEVTLPELLMVAVEILKEVDGVRTGKASVPAEEQARLNRLLDDLRAYSLDPDMSECFKVYGIPSTITNGFNTVCSIFLNQDLYIKLTDDELRAVIAHEMAHGINGDNLKNATTIVTSTIHHFAKLGIEEAIWLLTDETHDYFRETLQADRGSWDMIMKGAADRAVDVELNADVLGTRLLNKAGYSGEPLITALCKLHGVDPNNIPKDQEDLVSFRNYPSLYKRVQAIRKEMKF